MSGLPAPDKFYFLSYVMPGFYKGAGGADGLFMLPLDLLIFCGVVPLLADVPVSWPSTY